MHRATIRAFVQMLAVAGLLSGCTPGKPEVNGAVGITVLEEAWLSDIEVWTSGPSMWKSQLQPTPGHRLLRVLFQLERPVVGALDLSDLVLGSRSNAEISSKVRAFRLGVPKSVRYRIREGGAPGNVWRNSESGLMALLQSDVLILLSNPGGPYTLEVIAPDGDASESARGPLAVDAVFDVPSGAKDLELLLAIERPPHPQPSASSAPASNPSSSRDVFNTDDLDEQPAIVTAQPPVYPEELKRRGAEGLVVVEFILDTTGHAEPGSVRIIRSPDPGFHRSAKEFALRVLFRPGRVRGQAVRVHVRLPINFKIAPPPN